MMGSKVYLILLLVLGVARSAYSQSCPEEEDIFPCHCVGMAHTFLVICEEEEDMTLKDLKRVLSSFDKQYPLEVELFGINLGAAPTDFFKGFNIHSLLFSRCKIDQFSDEKGRILVGLEDTLENLGVSRTIEKGNSAAVLDLSPFKKLAHLQFSYNAMRELSDDWFRKGPTSLTSVYFINNGIEKLGSNVFANLPNLSLLILDGNQFGEMKRSMLPNPATHLWEMKLRDNDFQELPDDFFSEMPTLVSLSLDYNEFRVIREATFRNIWTQLRFLLLNGNPLNCEDSVLEWMVKASRTPEIEGQCTTPAERNGDKILDVIEGNQKLSALE